jgi:hypothetical protein
LFALFTLIFPIFFLARFSWRAATHLAVAVGHGFLARKSHTPFLIHAQTLDEDFVAELDDVLSLFHTEIGQFADVDQAIFARQKFDKGAEIFDGDNFAPINLADLGFSGHAHDGIARDLHAFGRDGEDVHRAIVFDVDFAAGFFDQLLDILSARSNESADFFGVDLEGLDARRVFADFAARLFNGPGHFREDAYSSSVRAFDSLRHKAVRNPAQFEIELEPSDAFFRAGDFAIHVTEGVLPADDVGQELVAGDLVLIIVICAQTDADAGHWPSHRHAGIHERKRTAAHAGHGGRAV